eukprot:841818_1
MISAIAMEYGHQKKGMAIFVPYVQRTKFKMCLIRELENFKCYNLVFVPQITILSTNATEADVPATSVQDVSQAADRNFYDSQPAGSYSPTTPAAFTPNSQIIVTPTVKGICGV